MIHVLDLKGTARTPVALRVSSAVPVRAGQLRKVWLGLVHGDVSREPAVPVARKWNAVARRIPIELARALAGPELGLPIPGRVVALAKRSLQIENKRATERVVQDVELDKRAQPDQERHLERIRVPSVASIAARKSRPVALRAELLVEEHRHLAQSRTDGVLTDESFDAQMVRILAAYS